MSAVMRTPMSPIVFSKIPPLDRVADKLGSIVKNPTVTELLGFLEKLVSCGPADAPIPNLTKLAAFIKESYENSGESQIFPLIDLFRAALSDPRISGWFAEEKGINRWDENQPYHIN